MKREMSIDKLVGNVNRMTEDDKNFIYDIEHYVWRGGRHNVMRYELAAALQKKIVGLSPEAGVLTYLVAFFGVRKRLDEKAGEFLAGYNRIASYIADPFSEGVLYYLRHHHDRSESLELDPSGITLVSRMVTLTEKSFPNLVQGAHFFEQTYQGLISKMPLN